MDTHTHSQTHTALWLLSCVQCVRAVCRHTYSRRAGTQTLMHRRSAQRAKADARSPQTPKVLTVVQEKQTTTVIEEDKRKAEDNFMVSHFFV